MSNANSEHDKLHSLEEQQQILEASNLSLEDRFEKADARVVHLQQNLQKNARYALQVQEALLHKEATLQLLFKEAFVLDRPKSIASGDFFWAAEVDECIVIALADCTGHDVTGAFMSLIGYELLNKIVREQGLVSPELILNVLNIELRKRLRQAETDNRDGIDLAICSIDKIKGTLVFAGAKAHALLVTNGTPDFLKGDRHPAGGLQKEGDLTYGRKEIHLDEPASLYLFSDGFQKQPGGTDCQKFLPKNFRQLLTDNADRPMQEQKAILETTFDKWLAEGNCAKSEQMDDVLVVGVRL